MQVGGDCKILAVMPNMILTPANSISTCGIMAIKVHCTSQNLSKLLFLFNTYARITSSDILP